MNIQSIRVGIIVEGNTERHLFKEHRTWFRDRGLEVIVVQARGRPRLIKEARSHLEVMRLKQCNWTFFLIDQDDDPCPPATAALLNSVRKEPDVIVCVISRQLEAWLLADVEAIQKTIGQPFTSLPTDNVNHPSKLLKKLFQRNKRKFPTKMEMVRAISRRFSFERAAKGNRSASRFLSKLP